MYKNVASRVRHAQQQCRMLRALDLKHAGDTMQQILQYGQSCFATLFKSGKIAVRKLTHAWSELDDRVGT